jgi:hypothetical protein
LSRLAAGLVNGNVCVANVFLALFTRDHQGRTTAALGLFPVKLSVRSIITAFRIPETSLHGV